MVKIVECERSGSEISFLLCLNCVSKLF